MRYWLHRISHEKNVSYPLLEKGYLSIGFSDFCYDEFIENVAENQNWEYFEKSFDKNWGERPKNRYCLWRFLAEMNKGDYVVVPSWGNFSVYRLCDDLPIVRFDENIELPESDWHGRKIITDGEGFLKLENEDDRIDIGFLRKVELICKDIPRCEYADSSLTSRLKMRNTNADITGLADSINRAINLFNQKKPLKLKASLLDSSAAEWNRIIVENFNPEKYEKLICSYFKAIGATVSYIPSKNYSDKVGDVDVIATFEGIRTVINVQAKFHKGETSNWAVEQIRAFASSKENMLDGYSYQYWVISSCDSFSEEAYKRAEENNVILIDGKQFTTMLINSGIELLEI